MAKKLLDLVTQKVPRAWYRSQSCPSFPVTCGPNIGACVTSGEKMPRKVNAPCSAAWTLAELHESDLDDEVSLTPHSERKAFACDTVQLSVACQS